jgi:hypothetical protein
MTSVSRLEFIRQEEWTVHVYKLKVEWDEASRAEFAADPAAFLRRQIESACGQPPAQGQPSSAPGGPVGYVRVNELAMSEEFFDLKGPPPDTMMAEHQVTPPRKESHWQVAPDNPEF